MEHADGLTECASINILLTNCRPGYVAMNIAFCVISIHWSGGNVATEIRNRTGVLSVMNMLPLFLLAGRNNPLIKLLDISFDTYNLLHRWIGRIAVLEAVSHTAAWMASKIMACKLCVQD